MDAIDAVIAYHEATKHHPGRFARSPGQLDWASQPEPFRRFETAPLHPLPLVSGDPTPPYDALFSGGIPAHPLTRDTLGALFEHALGLSAWKAYRGERWALRCNPSSGNLHPTEGYAVLPPVSGIHDGPAVYHYAPREHALERRADLTPDAWNALAAPLPENAFLVGLTSIHWREAWKYGERAFRYCQHDLGHAFAALAVSATALGWSMRRLVTPADAEIAELHGLARADDFPPGELEHPGLLAAVLPGAPTTSTLDIPSEAFTRAAACVWHGHAEPLSASHVPWTAIDDVARAAAKPRTTPQSPHLPSPQASAAHTAPISARTIIRRRRSAVAMDGHTACPRDAFYRSLARLMPDRAGPIWNAFATVPQVNLIFFVHRVEGLAPGIYGLVRNAGHEPRLRGAMRPDFSLAQTRRMSREPAVLPGSSRATAANWPGNCVADRPSHPTAHSRRPCSPHSTTRSSTPARGPTASSSRKPACSANSSTLRPKPPACAAPASGVSSTTLSTRSWASATASFSPSTTSPSAAPSTIPASPPLPPYPHRK